MLDLILLTELSSKMLIASLLLHYTRQLNKSSFESIFIKLHACCFCILQCHALLITVTFYTSQKMRK